MKLKVGDKAPEIKAKNQKGENFDFSEYRGKKIILYFYPKDSTAGCTAQACNLRDNIDELTNSGYVVVGVSPDNEKSHNRFIEKQDLPFDLIADIDKDVVEKYGVWAEKKMCGRTYMGVLRTTFIISEEGVVEEIIEKVKTKEHVKQILK